MVLGIRRTSISLGLVCSTLLFTVPVSAQEEHSDGSGGQHPFERNTLGLLLGFAKEGPRDNGVAIGIGYEHRFNARFGIGAIAEYTRGDIQAWVVSIPVAWHRGPWRFYVGPGFEDREGETEPLLRVGAEYGFHEGRWEIAPTFDVDFVDGEQIFVIGVAFLRGFKL